MLETKVYEEIVDFIASGPTPRAVVEFAPSDEAQARLEELMARQKGGELTVDERSELAHFLELEHLMRLAKARARERLAGGGYVPSGGAQATRRGARRFAV